MANTMSSTIGKGSMCDCMHEWEHEREWLQEPTERLAEMQHEAESILMSANGNFNDDEMELSDKEVECAIQREEVQEVHCSPISSGQKIPMKMCIKHVHEVSTEETDSKIDANVMSYHADLN
ncbi:hypothetical protein BDR06DRAFT_453520 [Suillus hirtellus]|nr:hypothetical protein BDR06DRAFT_453520 [Suillus hirtellus]